MGALNQAVPSQYSKLLVCKLKPIVPALAFLGLLAVFQEVIVGRPTIIDKFGPILIRRGEFFGIFF